MNDQLIPTSQIPDLEFRFKAIPDISNNLFLNDYIEIVINSDNLSIDGYDVQLITNISYYNHDKDKIEFSIILSDYNTKDINADIIDIFDRYFVNSELINPISIYYVKNSTLTF